MVFDDIQLPQVESLLSTFIELDERWEMVAGTSKWRAFRRSVGGATRGGLVRPTVLSAAAAAAGPMRRVKDLVPLPVKVRIKQWVGR